MVFTETRLPGAFIVVPQRLEDERGFFALSWAQGEFRARGLNWSIVECNISFNKRKGVLRGMHYQAAPYEQAKLVRCTRGSIYDVILDLRPESSTFKQWVAVELTADNRQMLYIPEGFAHGFQTLEHDTEVFYQMSQIYAPHSAQGVRWDDPAFDIQWPADVRIMNDRDRQYPDFVS
jgi:dTDP-4-dehydrorhamnose 3,5-epimerase